MTDINKKDRASFTKSMMELDIQAVDTVSQRIKQATLIYEQHFGKGTASAHPEAISQLVQAMTEEYAANLIGKCITQQTDDIKAYIDDNVLFR